MTVLTRPYLSYDKFLKQASLEVDNKRLSKLQRNDFDVLDALRTINAPASYTKLYQTVYNSKWRYFNKNMYESLEKLIELGFIDFKVTNHAYWRKWFITSLGKRMLESVERRMIELCEASMIE